MIAFDDQNKKLNEIESKTLAVSQELQKTLEENVKMKTEILRLSKLIDEQNVNVNKPEELNDEERAILIYNKLSCGTLPELKKFGDNITNPKIFISTVS